MNGAPATWLMFLSRSLCAQHPRAWQPHFTWCPRHTAFNHRTSLVCAGLCISRLPASRHPNCHHAICPGWPCPQLLRGDLDPMRSACGSPACDRDTFLSFWHLLLSPSRGTLLLQDGPKISTAWDNGIEQLSQRVTLGCWRPEMCVGCHVLCQNSKFWAAHGHL